MQRDLVERARRGDREAFALIADASITRLYNIAQLMLADADLAKDAVQETLIVTWRDLRALRDPERFDSWQHRILVRIVYRLARNERHHVQPVRLAGTDPGSTPDVAADVEDRDAVDRGFRHLRPEYRAVLVLHHYLGLSDDEAAEVLGVPVGTVKSRLHRATAAMRAELDADTRMSDGLAARTVR